MAKNKTGRQIEVEIGGALSALAKIDKSIKFVFEDGTYLSVDMLDHTKGIRITTSGARGIRVQPESSNIITVSL